MKANIFIITATPTAQSNIVTAIQTSHPNTQATSLYGNYGTAPKRLGSHLGIVFFFPLVAAHVVDFMALCRLSAEVAAVAKVGRADLINLLCVDTTFQAEILRTGRLIPCADEEAWLRFEAVIRSKYQRLN